jgi:hypothetical protein
MPYRRRRLFLRRSTLAAIGAAVVLIGLAVPSIDWGRSKAQHALQQKPELSRGQSRAQGAESQELKPR